MSARDAAIRSLLPDVLEILPKARSKRASGGAASNGSQAPLDTRRCPKAIAGAWALSEGLAKGDRPAAYVHPQDGGLRAMKTETLDSPLLTRDEAARYCRVGLRTFDRRVAPHLQPVSIGTRRFFDRKDIDTWLVSQKASPYTATSAPDIGLCVSPTTGNATSDPHVNAIAAALKRARRKSSGR